MTAPTVKDSGASSQHDEIYRPPASAATNTKRARRSFITRVVTGAAIGVFGALAITVLGLGEIFGSSGYDLIGPLALIGGVLGATRIRAILVGLAIAASLVIVIVACTSLAVGPAQSLIRRDPMPPAADAIVVLSAGITTDGTLQPQATDRLLKGLELYSRRVAPVLVLTREEKSFRGMRVTSQADQARLASLVAPNSGRIVYAGVTRSTREEAIRVRDLARTAGWKRIILVTSPIHSRRACRVFEHVGFSVTCSPSDSRDLAVNEITNPKDRLRAFQLWIYEVAGTIRYRQLGWI